MKSHRTHCQKMGEGTGDYILTCHVLYFQLEHGFLHIIYTSHAFRLPEVFLDEKAMRREPQGHWAHWLSPAILQAPCREITFSRDGYESTPQVISAFRRYYFPERNQTGVRELGSLFSIQHVTIFPERKKTRGKEWENHPNACSHSKEENVSWGGGGAASDENVGEGLNCLPGPRAYSNLLREGPRR